MKRELSKSITSWNSSPRRKPLILMGARQVGKSWLMEDFASACYPGNAVFVNFMENERLRENVESSNLDPQTLMGLIELETGQRIEPGKTLLVLDEIQESPRALTALKFFNEKMSSLAVIAAGSLLGLSLRRRGREGKERSRGSFPVGKVDFLEVGPLSFGEFLSAIGEETRNDALVKNRWNLIQLQHDAYIGLLKSYLFIGGMPEAVNAFAETHSYQEVRRIQNAILTAYDKDFEKHAPPQLLAKLRLLWNNIPAQLAKENKKFIYTALREGARAREFEEALQWLDDAAMIRLFRRVNVPRLPLKAYEDFTSFKLYLVDVGLLGALSELRPDTLLDGSTIFTNFRGTLTEQFVLQELNALGLRPRYWTADRGTAEVDFVVAGANGVFPIEAKAGRNLKSRSLSVYQGLYQPERLYRVSLERYQPDGAVCDFPLYALRSLAEEIDSRSGEKIMPDGLGR